MEDQYGMADLRQYMSGRSFFQPISRPPPPQPPDLLSSHQGLTSPHPYDMLMFRSDSTSIAPAANTSAFAASSSGAAAGGGLCGFEMEAGGLIGGGGSGDGCTGRWPRQETLTLLEIRSKLDPKFKEANQKGPLWEEVSRIMSEEHGYQRTGKKCREKFENLYKYYKKTKEGKAGRQDGKHYRFFRQLEALYGENNNSASASETHLVGGNFQYNFTNNNISLANNQESYLGGPKLSDTSLVSLSHSSDSDTTSSDDSCLNVGIDRHDPKKKKRRGKRGLKAKIREFIDAQMKKLMEKQEAWMEKMMRTIEHKEQERMLREEQWRKQDAARIEREHKLWASERAWIEARDAALMDAFHKLTGKELRASPPEELMMIRSLSENQNNDDGSDQTMTNSVKAGDIWPECEITRLIQLRTGMELKFQQSGISEEVLWEDIATKMACFGHERSGLMCKEKWDSVNNYLLKCNKKRRENSKGCSFYQNHESICDQGGVSVSYCDTSEQGINEHAIRLNDNNGNSPVNSNAGNAINDSCFRYFIGDAYGRIMN